MPEKVRVSPAPASQLSTGSGQAALVPEDAEPLDEEPDDDAADDEPDVPAEVDDAPDDEDSEEDAEEDSDFAGTELLPDDRLSVR
jgi:hypothetical protein